MRFIPASVLFLLLSTGLCFSQSEPEIGAAEVSIQLQWSADIMTNVSTFAIACQTGTRSASLSLLEDRTAFSQVSGREGDSLSACVAAASSMPSRRGYFDRPRLIVGLDSKGLPQVVFLSESAPDFHGDAWRPHKCAVSNDTVVIVRRMLLHGLARPRTSKGMQLVRDLALIVEAPKR